MDLLEVAKQRKMLLEAGVLEKISFLQPAEALAVLLEAESKAAEKKQVVITNALVSEILSEKAEGQKALQAPVEVEKPLESAKNEDFTEDGFQPSLKILSHKTFDCTGTVEDFVMHFRNRLSKISALLKNRAATNSYATIEQSKNALDNRKSRIIGITDSKGVTKKGNIRFSLEDETGVITCITSSRNRDATKQAEELWPDDIVAVDGSFWQGMFMVEGITWPEIPIRPKKAAGVKEDVSIAFMSDLHVGSRYFLENNFERALGFFNGAGGEEEREIAKTIRYLIIAGDLVDGIGVYPKQEKQLVTKSIFEQYELLAEYLKKIPSRIQVIISPGNHDAVRDAEPQPPLHGEFVHAFEQKNFHFVPNPCWLDIHGLKILVYHGTSIDALVSNSQKLGDAFEHPEKVAIEILRRRHLSPTYGEKPIIPSHEDGMVVDDVPDVFHFGHVHKNAAYDYNGTLIINSGAWQAETDFQQTLGRKPSPCLLPVYNIRTGVLKILDFTGEEGAAGRLAKA